MPKCGVSTGAVLQVAQVFMCGLGVAQHGASMVSLWFWCGEGVVLSWEVPSLALRSS